MASSRACVFVLLSVLLSLNNCEANDIWWDTADEVYARCAKELGPSYKGVCSEFQEHIIDYFDGAGQNLVAALNKTSKEIATTMTTSPFKERWTTITTGIILYARASGETDKNKIVKKVKDAFNQQVNDFFLKMVVGDTSGATTFPMGQNFPIPNVKSNIHGHNQNPLKEGQGSTGFTADDHHHHDDDDEEHDHEHDHSHEHDHPHSHIHQRDPTSHSHPHHHKHAHEHSLNDKQHQHTHLDEHSHEDHQH